MTSLGQIAVWIFFMATSVYGHVALKLGAASLNDSDGPRAFFRFADDPWTLTGLGAWTISGILWVLILRGSPLFAAMSTSSLRYALVCIAAVVFLRESFDKQQAVGMMLIAAGVFLVGRS